MQRLHITLDDDHAEKLARLAERADTEPGAVAQSLLAAALDEADPDPQYVTELLNSIPGALERAKLGSAQGRAGRVIPLDEL